MCANIWRILVKEPPPSKTAIHKRKFPARAFVRPGVSGWLYHVVVFCGQFGLWHVEVTTAAVPTAFASTNGLSALHEWQKLKSSRSCDRNTMCFGSDRRFPLCCNNLKQAKVQHYNYAQ